MEPEEESVPDGYQTIAVAAINPEIERRAVYDPAGTLIGHVAYVVLQVGELMEAGWRPVEDHRSLYPTTLAMAVRRVIRSRRA